MNRMDEARERTRRGIEAQRPARTVPLTPQAEARICWAADFSVEQTAFVVGASCKTVRRWYAAWQAETRPPLAASARGAVG